MIFDNLKSDVHALGSFDLAGGEVDSSPDHAILILCVGVGVKEVLC